MDLYKVGSLFLDISIGLLVLGAIIRVVLAMTYYKRNSNRTLTDSQRKSLRRAIIPIAVAGLAFGIVALALLLLC